MASIELSNFLAAQPVGSLPDAVYAKSARVLADTCAAILAGAQEPEMLSLAAATLTAGGAGPAGHV